MEKTVGLLVLILLGAISIMTLVGILYDGTKKEKRKNKPDKKYHPPSSITKQEPVLIPPNDFIEVKNIEEERIMLKANEIKSIREIKGSPGVQEGAIIERKQGNIFACTKYEDVVRQLAPRIFMREGM